MTLLYPKPVKEPKKRKQMRKISHKRANKYKTPAGKFDLKYMGLVKQLPCVICMEFDMVPLSQIEAHHPIHGRFGTRKAADIDCIPLCQGHHAQGFDKSKVELHAHPSQWKRLYGEDHQYIEATQDAIERRFGVRIEDRPND